MVNFELLGSLINSIIDIMHACDIIPFQWPRKEEKKNKSKHLYIKMP
jgi:hypothetical protein